MERLSERLRVLAEGEDEGGEQTVEEIVDLAEQMVANTDFAGAARYYQFAAKKAAASGQEERAKSYRAKSKKFWAKAEKRPGPVGLDYRTATMGGPAESIDEEFERLAAEVEGDELTEGFKTTVGGKSSDRKLVHNIGTKIEWSPDRAMAICVLLLQDVNLHDEAAAVDKLLARMSESADDGLDEETGGVKLGRVVEAARNLKSTASALMQAASGGDAGLTIYALRTMITDLLAAFLLVLPSAKRAKFNTSVVAPLEKNMVRFFGNTADEAGAEMR